ncbi:phage tail assembly protein [Chitinophaga sp. CF418]|uniref:phage tail assembly protein n=1 Tax=Chitinophaga sp. CF418 TaxID=1855287 RepID=UPI0009116330|nr:phage tail assembly protein [Chitinophaga sp. CF418]SHN42238.1 hypothetical protein SAMN05216311_114147 [Chitinophaga sp. CF418]
MNTVDSNEAAKSVTPFLDLLPSGVLPESFPDGERIIDTKDAAGSLVKCVLFADGKTIARVRKGKGKDVEKATIIAGKDQSKYMSALMAAVVTISGEPVIMEQLADLDMSDYIQVQVAFSELNF